ncbi:MAG: prepilin-type N-terminal cleavage/methylation domain-containing protein [Thermodesulfobacteriota bacterium]|nr:prepilin-type N-terminal cleavage/methylation domain-containing protein [Thermodesulfobacteriota bacterium]
MRNKKSKLIKSSVVNLTFLNSGLRTVIPAKAGIQIEKTGFRIKSGMTKYVKSYLNKHIKMRKHNSELRTLNSELQKGFTLIEIIIVIVILSIVSGITIKFLIDSLKIYTMTVNQKTLFDEGKLAMERMCRDIRDANGITGTTASSITFTRAHTTVQDVAGETIIFQLNAGTGTLQKDKSLPLPDPPPVDMASNVTGFVVTNATNEIQLRLTLQLTSGESVRLQTKVYPKNLPPDVTPLTATYNKHFGGNWKEVKSPDAS